MSVLETGIVKEEFLLPNNQKLLVEYGIDGEDAPIPKDESKLMDMTIAGRRRLSLFDESGKLIGTRIEKNPHEVTAEPGMLI
jgi:hypothetical protein